MEHDVPARVYTFPVLPHFLKDIGCNFQSYYTHSTVIRNLVPNINRMLNRDAKNSASCEPVDPQLTNTSSQV